MPHALSLQAEPVALVLEAEGFQRQADDLRSAARAGACERVAEMCHPKWLGDLHIESKKWQEWWNMLSDLKCQALGLSAQKSPPDSAE
jgi:hypothetical protein